jgi:hypothetical protein
VLFKVPAISRVKAFLLFNLQISLITAVENPPIYADQIHKLGRSRERVSVQEPCGLHSQAP